MVNLGPDSTWLVFFPGWRWQPSTFPRGYRQQVLRVGRFTQAKIEKNTAVSEESCGVTNETAEGTSGFVVYVHKELFLAALAEVLYMNIWFFAPKIPLFFQSDVWPDWCLGMTDVSSMGSDQTHPLFFSEAWPTSAADRIYARIAFGTTFYGFGNLVWMLEMVGFFLPFFFSGWKRGTLGLSGKLI